MRRWMMIFLCFTLFIPLLTAVTAAQSTLIHLPGDAGREAVKGNAHARAEYFFNRKAWPAAVIPEGAREKAFREIQSMSLFRAAGKTGAMRELRWNNIGPFNVGGRIFALALNPKRPATMFAGAANGGVWRSYDAGLTWESVSEDFPTQAMGSLIIDPVDTNIVYAGTGDASFGSLSFDGAGMFKSTDGGQSWFEVGAGTLPDFANISDMAINPVNTSVLYAAVPDGVRDAQQHGIWRTQDGGDSWDLVFQGRVTDVVINPLDPDILYTVSSIIFQGGPTPANQGLYKSTDGGDTWQQLDIGVPHENIGRTAIGICAAQPDVLYLGVSEIVGPGRTALLGVFRTSDGGVTWTELHVPFDYMIPQGWFDNVIGVHPTNPDIVYAGGVKLIRSSDGGRNWERVPDQLAGGILHVDQHEIEFDPFDPDRVYVGNDGGLYLLTDEGRTLDKRDIGMSITQFIGGDMYPGSDLFAFGGTQDNGTLISDRQINFDLSLYGDGGHGFIHPETPNRMYTTQERLKLWRSDDFGRTWVWANGDLPNEGSLFYIAYDMDRHNPDRLFLGTYRMYRSLNGGRNWDQRQLCLFQSPTGGCYYITAVSIAPYDSDLILAAAPGQTALSTDGGSTWTVTSTELPISACTAFRTFEPGIMYATFSAYGVPKVWKSNDNGMTWQNINGDLPDIPTYDVIELDGALIIGTELGAFISGDDGATWQRLGTGMPALCVQRLLYQPETGVLRAITHGRGMYDMQWKELPSRQPVFASSPPTDVLQPMQPFVYAPVVLAVPRPVFRLTEAPAGASIDEKLGVVRWIASDTRASFTIEAENAAGISTQQFEVRAHDVPRTDWEIVSPEPMDALVNHVFLAEDNSLWLARDTAWVSRSTDEGRSWNHVRLPDTEVSVLSVFAFDAMTALVGTGGPQSLMNTGSGHIWKTTDGGQSWRDMLYGIDSRFANIHFTDDLNGLAVSQGARDSADVFLTSDGGESWRLHTRVHAPVPMYNTLAFGDAQMGCFAVSNYYDQGNASLMRTTDRGLSWEPKSFGAGMIYVSDLVFIDDRNGWGIDEMTRTIKKTTSGGQRWITTSYPMNGERLISLHADPPSGVVWVLSDEHAWASKDLGMTWTKTTLVPAGAMAGVVFADSVQGWAVSRNGSVQRLARDPFVVSARLLPAPVDIRLPAPWPNPLLSVSEAVHLPFSIDRPSSVRLVIVNTKGKEVAVITEGQYGAGEHYAAWRPEGLSNGVYFITLIAGDRRVSRGIVLAR
jgi:photosystem II stability/assembly factor-like uncharacterized protein